MRDKNVIIMSLWFNWLNLQNPPRRFDHQSIFSSNIPDLRMGLQRHLTYNDKAFGEIKLRQALVNLVAMDEFKQ